VCGLTPAVFSPPPAGAGTHSFTPFEAHKGGSRETLMLVQYNRLGFGFGVLNFELSRMHETPSHPFVGAASIAVPKLFSSILSRFGLASKSSPTSLTGLARRTHYWRYVDM